MLIECIRAWRKTRHPRWAALADWCTDAQRPVVGAGKKKADLAAWQELEKRQDPHDLPRLFEALKGMASTRAAELLPALSAWNDPRTVTQLLALLEAPPWRAQPALPFFRAAVKLLGDSKDVRARDGMKALGERYKSIIDSSVGDSVGALLRRTAGEMKVVETALEKDEEARVAELEAQFPAQRASAASRSAVKQGTEKNDQVLLEAIWAAPQDDGPRLVFADALQHRGDVRGELIALQVARARGAATPQSRAREYELLTDSKRFIAWTAPVSQGGECLVARGFPSQVTLNARSIGSVAGSPAWATVTAVRALNAVPQTHAKKLFDACPSLSDVGEVNEKVIELARERVTQWRAAGLSVVPGPELCARLAGLERLALSSGDFQERTLPEGFFAPFRRLKRLELKHRIAVHALPDVTELQMADVAGLKLPKTLERLEVQRAPGPAVLAGVPLKTLRCHHFVAAELEALLAAAPTLREVEMYTAAPAELVGVLKLLREGRLDSVTMGHYRYHGDLVLDATWWDPELPRKLEAMGVRPSRVRMRPARAEPDGPVAPPPSEERLARIRAGLEPLGIPVEAAWY